VSLNFDAQINLDVAPFLASIDRARGAVKQLNDDINALNSKKLTPATGGGSGAGVRPDSSVPGRRREADAIMAQADARDHNVRSLARERYALYDVAAAYAAASAIALGAVRGLSQAAITYERAFADVNRTTDFVSIKDRFDTVTEAARVMKYSLTQVAAEIPVAFGKITEIATIGNQLGLAQGQLESFSKTVAQFSSLTGMTTTATAMSFGRIGELLNETDYNKLGSSIAYAGVQAVATEEQIASVTKEIATTAKMAKFTTPEVVGLATALSSVGIAPEAARGSIIRTFAGINQAISEGGDKLMAYANIAGMPSDVFAQSWQTNGQGAFDAFLGGLQSMSDNGQNLDTVLRGLGMVNVRDIQTIQKLGDNYDVYAEAIGTANKGYAEGTFLSEAYGKIQDTVAAKLELLNNNWMNLQATLGEGVTGDLFKGFLDALTTLLQQLNDAARNPFVRDFVMPVILALTTLVGVFAAINGVAALARASMLAYGTAMGITKLNADGLTVSLQKGALATTFFNTALKSTGWLLAIGAIIQGLSLLSAALAPIEQRAESMLGGFAGLQDAFTADTAALKENAQAAGQTVDEYARANDIMLITTDAVAGNTEEVQKAAIAQSNLAFIIGEQPAAFVDSANGIATQTIAIGENTMAWLKNSIAQSGVFQGLSKNEAAMAALVKGGYNINDALKAAASGGLKEYTEKFTELVQLDTSGGNWRSLPIIGIGEQAKIGNARQDISKLMDAIGGAYTQMVLLGLGSEQASKKVANAFKIPESLVRKVADQAKKSVKTVVDYANALGGIFKRIDDIQFSRQTGLDNIAAGWKKIADDAKSAQEAIDSANQSIRELTADRGILQYQLDVAVRYGDTKRAEAIRAKLQKNTTDLTKANEDLKEAQDSSNKSLTAQTTAGAANRAALIGMLGDYQEYIKSLAATGMKGKELEDAIAALKSEFQTQGEALGFSTGELTTYLGMFDSYIKTVRETPRNVTVEFDATKTPEFNALQEYLAKEQNLNVKVNYQGGAPSIGGGIPAMQANPIDSTGEAADAIKSRLTTLNADMAKAQTIRARENISSQITALTTMLRQLLAAESAMVGAQNLSYSAAVGFSNQRAAIIKAVASGNFTGKYATGGLIRGAGSGVSDSVPILASNGEFVVSAAAVNAYGVDFMNSLNQMKLGRMSFSATASTATSGEQMVYLSPEDRQLLRAAIDRPVNLYADSTQIATTANNGNVLLAQRGLN
jgi:TP901 family phage tail tape measure protein